MTDPTPEVVSIRRAGSIGLLGVVGCLVGMTAVHVLPPSSDKDPFSRTISEYALMGNAWLFVGAVLAMAVGSGFLMVGLVRSGRLVLHSVAGWCWSVWCLGLVGLVVFPKTDFGPDTTVIGRIHWTFTLLAFVALPLALLLTPRLPPAVRLLAWISVGWFAVLVGQTVLGAFGVPSWQWVGAIERGLSLTEGAAVFVVALTLAGDPARRASPADDREVVAQPLF